MKMRPERRKGLRNSAIFHVAIILLTIFGLPALFSFTKDPEPMAITVEILPISAISNVKPSEMTPVEKPKEKEKPKEQKKTEPKKEEKPKEKPVPPVEKEKPKPEPVPEEKEEPKPEEKKPEPIPEKKKEEKKEEKKKEKPKEKPKPKEEDLDAILKSIEKENEQALDNDSKEKNEDSASDTKSKSSNYDPTVPMSISETDAIRNHFGKCWNMPAGAKNDHELVVLVNARFNPDGTVIKAELSLGSRAKYMSDTFYRAAADAAVRAVYKCSPLPAEVARPDKYGGWAEMDINFDPKDMLY